MPAMVLAVIRAYPKDVIENASDLISRIDSVLKERGFSLAKWESVEIAFGYKALDLYVMMPEETERGTEDAEEAIKSIDEIDNVDVIYITRLST